MNILKSLFTILVIALITSCNRPSGTISEEQQNGTKDSIRVPSTEKPRETISLERAHAMYEAYQERFNAVTKFRNGQEDSRYGWHSIDFYKNYIAYLEAESKKVNIEISGLRLYYVAYPNDETSKEYKDYQTYIYVPTYLNKETNKHIAFDPLHIGADGKPIPIHEIITTGGTFKKSNMASSVAREESASSVANMGEMCKPNCSE